MATESYDVAIIGSGAGGATSAFVLANAGLKVILLEAGRDLNPARDFHTHTMPWQLPFRGAGKPGQYDGLWKINEYTAHLYTNPLEDRYDNIETFHWTRLRAVGGRTNTWGRSCYRHGPLDFKTKSMQGFGEDWPISYEDLAPWYDKAERLVGISGHADGYFNMPDGVYAAPAHAWRCTELDLKKKLDAASIPLVSERTAVLSRPYDGRPACHYCGACGNGCDVRARFSSLDVIIPKLRTKPNFTLRTHAIAHEVLVNDRGLARGVHFIDAVSRKDYEIEAKAVVVAASTGETGRILLNSKSRFHPNGMGNSTGLVGHYLMDSVKSGPMTGIVPEWRNRPRSNEDGAGGTHVTIPRFNYKRKDDYHGGYFILTSTGFPRGMMSAGAKGYGAQLKESIRRDYGSTLTLRAYGECLPVYENRFELDPEKKDAYNIPQIRFRCGHSDNSKKMMEDMYGWMERILKAAGAEILPYRKYLEPLGDATHECGTARMGNDPRTSVLNSYGQSHEVKNLFLADASGFVSLPGTHGITTWIMALAWRGAEYLADRMKKGELA